MFPNTPMQAEQTQGMQTAIHEIRTFAAQMQEITALFARGQADMARQLEVTTIRLDKAVETVAMGEARIAAQIASFERMANEMRRAAEEHDRGLRGVIESFQRGTAELANEALRPLKAEIEGMSREVAGAKNQIASAGIGISAALETAVGVVQSGTERVLRDQLDGVASFVTGTINDTTSKVTAVSEVFDQAAGTLAHRIWAAVEAQDAKLGSLESLSDKLGVIKEAAAAQDNLAARLARTEAAAFSMDEASKAVTLASSKIITAVIEMKSAKTDGGPALVAAKPNHDGVANDQSRVLEAVNALGILLDTAIVRASAERGEAVTEMLQRLDALNERLAPPAPVPSPQAAESLPVLVEEKESLQRVLMGFKLLLRDINGETERLRSSVDAVAARAEQPISSSDGRVERAIGAVAEAIMTLDRKIDGINIGPPESMSMARNADDLPNFASERESIQRMLVGFRLLLRDIGGESTRLKQVVEGLSGQAGQALTVASRNDSSPLVQARLDQNFAALGAAIERLDGKLDRLKPTEAEEAVAAVEQIEPTAAVIEREKISLQRMLIGFRLLLQEISAETTSYREKVAGIRQPEMLVLSPTIEAEALAPLQAAADRIAEGVAESLAALEQKLAEPVARLSDVTAGNVEALRIAQEALAAPTPTRGELALSPRDSDSLEQAVLRMERASVSIDDRIGQVDQLLTALRKGGALSADALRDLFNGMQSAASVLRSEAGEFLAIGAALSRELEASLPVAEAVPQPRRSRMTQHAKKKVA
jgi:hypothetical protein